MKPAIDIQMVGVGGQGTILASDILAEAALLEGFDVKKSDALGMSQRGGSVVSHVRLGPRVYSPLVKQGEADVLVGFEKLEAARWAGHLRPGGLVIINDQAIPPFSVSSGFERYPSDETIMELLHRRTSRVFVVGGLALAQAAGNPRTLNAAMLGFLSVCLESTRLVDGLQHAPARASGPGWAMGATTAPAGDVEIGLATRATAYAGSALISKDAWTRCLARALPPMLLDMNLIAFDKGRLAAQEALSFQRPAGDAVSTQRPAGK